MKPWTTILKLSAYSAIANRSAVLWRVVCMFLNNFVFLAFWWILFGNVKSLSGSELSDILGIFGLAAIAFGCATICTSGFIEIPAMIRSGDFDRLLLLPKPTLGLLLTSRTEPFALGDILSGVVIVWLSGHLTLSGLPLILLAIFCGSSIIVSFGTIIFSLAFFVRKSDEASFRIWESLITMALYPESIFSITVRFLILVVLPGSFIGSIPFIAVKYHDWSLLLYCLGSAAVFFLLCGIVFRLGIIRFLRG